MPAFYNELEPYAAQWLRNLSDAGHIAPGTVDERSIKDLNPSDLAGYQQCHFFAGIGVWSYALRLAGIPDEFPVWTGSCPCQPFSSAGKGLGFSDPRHLWPDWLRLIRECRPPIVFGEQVSGGDGYAWLDLVHTSLETCGYTVGALVAPAASVGAPHMRHRTYFVAHAGRERLERECLCLLGRGPQQDCSKTAGGGEVGFLGDAQCSRLEGRGMQSRASSGQRVAGTAGPVGGFWGDASWIDCRDGFKRPVEPGSFPLASGVANRVGRIRAAGNAIVAPLAATLVRAAIEAIAEQTQ